MIRNAEGRILACPPITPGARDGCGSARIAGSARSSGYECLDCALVSNSPILAGGYICPKCGSNNLDVVVEVWAKLIQEYGDENIRTDIEDASVGHDHEWTEKSFMRCNQCHHQGIAADFDLNEGMLRETLWDEREKR